MTNYEVAKAFFARKKAQCANMRTDGHKLWSYRALIAEWLDNEKADLVINVHDYSATTRKHQADLRSVLDSYVSNYKVRYVDTFGYGRPYCYNEGPDSLEAAIGRPTSLERALINEYQESGTLTLWKEKGVSVSICYGGYGLQFCNATNSSCIGIFSGNWRHDGGVKVPMKAQKAMHKIARLFKDNGELKTFINRIKNATT